MSGFMFIKEKTEAVLEGRRRTWTSPGTEEGADRVTERHRPNPAIVLRSRCLTTWHLCDLKGRKFRALFCAHWTNFQAHSVDQPLF